MKITIHTTPYGTYKIAPKAETAFIKELNALQDRCNARIVSGYEIFKAILEYENRLSRFLSYKDMKGASVEIDLNAQTFPNAYKYTPHSTVVKIECSAPRSWTILSIKRGITQKDVYECKKFSDLQKSQILENVIKNI